MNRRVDEGCPSQVATLQWMLLEREVADNRGIDQPGEYLPLVKASMVELNLRPVSISPASMPGQFHFGRIKIQ